MGINNARILNFEFGAKQRDAVSVYEIFISIQLELILDEVY